MTKKYEYTCPKCGAIALVWVDDITLNDEVVGQRTEERCFSCGYRKANYKNWETPFGKYSELLERYKRERAEGRE